MHLITRVRKMAVIDAVFLFVVLQGITIVYVVMCTILSYALLWIITVLHEIVIINDLM